LNARETQRLIAAGETLLVEFKGEARAPLSDDDVVEAVICLANRASSEPAWLLIGVEDDGRITGARPRHGDRTDQHRLQAMIANRTRPSLAVEVDLVVLDGQAVLAIQVPTARVPVGTTEGRYLRRVTGGRGRPECVPMHFHDMVSMQADQGQLDYSGLVLPGVGWDDLDPLEFERFRRSIREAKGLGDTSLVELSDLELAKALGAVEANHTVRGVRVLGLLLFGREEALRSHLPAHEAAFQQLSGLQVAANEFFRLPLIRLMDELMARFRARYREDEVMVGMLRVGVPDYPERAFREGVANALVHQDLTRLAAVHVQWYDDRIEISNPGGFPEGVRLDNLLVTPPRPRSPLLADAFKRAGIVERTARGIDTIFYEQLRNGRPAPDYSRSTERDVILVLPGGDANLDFVRLVAEVGQSGRALGLDELLALNALWLERQLDTAQAAELIQKPDAEARAVIARLVEAGLVEARGQRRGRMYHLSARTYQRLGAKAAYVRQRGFEPLQQAQMVLQFVEKHGRITRREAAELAQLSPDQATRLLARLVREDKLVMHGSRKSAWYGLPAAPAHN
jgi:ATP-dependent DNA helicase RecG